MKQRVTALLIVLMLWAMAAPGFAASPFSDVPADHWAYDSITKLAAAGLIVGYPDGSFGGQRQFTRYEMAMVFARVMDRMEIWIDDRFAGTSDELKADIFAEVSAELDKQLAGLRKQLAEKPENTVVERVIEKPVRQVIETTVVEKPFELTEEAKAVLADFVAQQLAGEAEQLVKQFDADMDHLVFAATSAELAAEDATAKADAAQKSADAAAAAAKAAGDKAAAAFGLGTKNTSEMTRVKAAVAALEGDVDTVKAYIESEVEALGAEMAAMNAEFRDELDVIGIRLKNLETVFSKLYDRVAGLETTVTANTAKIEELTAANAAQDAKLAGVEKQVSDLQRDTEDNWNENIAQSAQIADLEARVADLESAQLAALNDSLNKVRFGGSLESKYASTGDYDAGSTKSFTQKATLEATVPTKVATLKASSTLTGKFDRDAADTTSVELKVRAEDMEFVGLDWYGELVQSTEVLKGDGGNAEFNFGLGKDFSMFGLPAGFDAEKSLALTDDGFDTTKFTLSLDKFLLDNLSTSVAYGYTNGKPESTVWETGFDLDLSFATMALDWTKDEDGARDGQGETKTALELTVPVIDDSVDVIIGGAKKVQWSDDDTAYDFNGAVKVKF